MMRSRAAGVIPGLVTMIMKGIGWWRMPAGLVSPGL
jgi:hypothetical protein